MPGMAPAKIPISHVPRPAVAGNAHGRRIRAHKSQAGLPPYSKEWWQAQDGIEAEQDAKVNRSLVICQGCLPAKPQPEDSRLAKAAD